MDVLYIYLLFKFVFKKLNKIFKNIPFFNLFFPNAGVALVKIEKHFFFVFF